MVKTRFLVLIVAVILIVAVVLTAVFLTRSDDSTVAVVTVDGETVYLVDLSKVVGLRTQVADEFSHHTHLPR